jgi:hypothetical protein
MVVLSGCLLHINAGKRTVTKSASHDSENTSTLNTPSASLLTNDATPSEL